MWLPLGNDTVVVKDFAWATDPVTGELYRDIDSPTSITVYQCLVQPFELSGKLANEYNIDREFTTSLRKFYLPPVAAALGMTPSSHLVFDGVEYDVLGTPGVWRDFDGTVSHVEVVGKDRQG